MMAFGYILGGLILTSAAALGLIEVALGPDSGRFPCVSKKLIWAARVLTTILAGHGFFTLRAAQLDAIPMMPLDQVIGRLASAGALAFFLTFLLSAIMSLRLDEGLWRRLQARVERAKRLSKAGPQGTVLAKLAADGLLVAAPLEGPEVVLDAAQTLRSLP